MTRPTCRNGAFDPECCPLLRGLSPEEQQRRMETDPLIRACVRSVEAGGEYPTDCRADKPRAGGRRRKTRLDVFQG